MQAIPKYKWLVTLLKVLMWALLALMVIELCRKPLWGA